MTEPVSTLLDRMADALRRHLSAQHITAPALVGIHTGGVWVAEQLHQRLDLNEPLGKLDISFYRDDFSRMGMHPQVRPSSLPFAVDDRHILLVDDVLFTGRTIRAAMNELFDYGRPASVMLAVLVERDGRELPIQAQVVGQHLKLRSDEQVKLRGPDPLRLDIVKLEPAS